MKLLREIIFDKTTTSNILLCLEIFSKKALGQEKSLTLFVKPPFVLHKLKPGTSDILRFSNHNIRYSINFEQCKSDLMCKRCSFNVEFVSQHFCENKNICTEIQSVSVCLCQFFFLDTCV